METLQTMVRSIIVNKNYFKTGINDKFQKDNENDQIISFYSSPSIP